MQSPDTVNRGGKYGTSYNKVGNSTTPPAAILYSCQGSTELERLCNEAVTAYWRYCLRVTRVATHRTCETVAISSVSAGDATARTANETKSQTLLCQYIQTTLSRFY
jgi:hypothetical protein